MKRLRTYMLPLALLVVSGVGWAAPAADQHEAAAAVVLSGFYSVTFNVHLGSTVPAGATVTCKAKIEPGAGILENPGGGVVPVEVAVGVVRISGNRGSCSVEIPFSWTVNNPRSGVALSYEIDAVSGLGDGSGPVGARVCSRALQRIGAFYPPAGGTASLRLDVML